LVGLPRREKQEPGHGGPAPFFNLIETGGKSNRQFPWQRVLLKQLGVPGFDW
jgi:hypothetical protein